VTDQPFKNEPLSPEEQFANICDAICDDESFDTEVEIDEQRSKAAMDMMCAALDEALAVAPKEESGTSRPQSVSDMTRSTPATPAPQPTADTTAAKTRVSVITDHRRLPPAETPPPPVRSPQWLPARRYVAARQFVQTFGLHPVTAVVLTGVNLLLFSAAWGTVGASLVFSIPIGFVVGLFAYNAQKKWYGDNKRFAYIKALILAILTAIPIPLPLLLFVPAGILGFFRRKTRENQETQVR
jgi:hypothetical protein